MISWLLIIERLLRVLGYLGWEVGPVCHTFILDDDRLHSGQNHIFGYFYPESAHACDEDTGRAHPVHTIAAEDIPEQTRTSLSRSSGGSEAPLGGSWGRNLQLSGVEAFIDSIHSWHVDAWQFLFRGTDNHRQIVTPAISSYSTDLAGTVSVIQSVGTASCVSLSFFWHALRGGCSGWILATRWRLWTVIWQLGIHVRASPGLVHVITIV